MRMGVIGGLGMRTSNDFCLNIALSYKGLTQQSPDIVIENVPVTKSMELESIRGDDPKDLLEIIREKIRMLNKAGSDFITIPCNTVHVYLEGLRSESSAPILSIIEETANECEARGYRKVLLISSSRTIKQQLYLKELEKRNIKIECPDKDDQLRIDRAIANLQDFIISDTDKDTMDDVMSKFDGKVDGFIFGCTDLYQIGNIKPNVIDSKKALEDKATRLLLKEEELRLQVIGRNGF